MESKEANIEYLRLRKEYEALVSQANPDLAATKNLRRRVQLELNKQFGRGDRR